MRNFIKLIYVLLFIFSSYCDVFSQWTVTGNFTGGYVSSVMTTGDELYAGTTVGIFRSDNNGANWIQINSGLGNNLFVQCLSFKDNYIFAGTSSGGVFYSDNKGASWTQSNQGLGQLNIKALITDSANVYAGCVFAGIFRSTNDGLSWSRFGLGEGDLLYALSYNETNFFVGLYGGIYRSTNSGVNWMMAQNGLTNNDVRTIVQTGNKTYCGTYGGGVFVTENNGIQWTSASTGLTELRVITLTPYGDDLFAGTYTDGIFYYNASSGIWTQINQCLPDTIIASIAIKDEYLFAGSSTGKVWKRPLSEIITGISNSGNSISEDFELYQNYPNPFNPVTSISFYLPERNSISLKIFDGLGREISEIYSGVLSEGKHNKFWNAESYPAGVYFYRLQSAFSSVTKKLVLIK
ncbi:MAG: T9SS type A sorting domain-containing protein [Ignavibacteria bacterium]|nr:T9SS type A sorting domain-containing protein [Ignavibacteria bacterium]